MNNTDTQKIYPAMVGIFGDCQAIEKGQRNKTQGFSFRGIDDVYQALHGVFAKNGVFVLPYVMEHTVAQRETKSGGVMHHHLLKIRFAFVASDGSQCEAVSLGEAMDSGDKGATKAASIALKYALFQIFLIPVRDLPDADEESYETRKSAAPIPNLKPATQLPEKTPEEARNDFVLWCGNHKSEAVDRAMDFFGVGTLGEITPAGYRDFCLRVKQEETLLSEAAKEPNGE